jgi:hypothetical protein
LTAELKPIRPEVDLDVVKKVEELLARVKSGETTGFLLLEQKRDVCTWTHTRLKNRFEIMGYLLKAAIEMEKP